MLFIWYCISIIVCVSIGMSFLKYINFRMNFYNCKIVSFVYMDGLLVGLGNRVVRKLEFFNGGFRFVW